MVEDTESECELGELSVRHHHIWLESAFGRAHTREIDAEASAPVVLLKIPQVASHHHAISAPVFEPDEDPHPDFMETGTPHAVVTVEAPVENAFHAMRVIFAISVTVVSFLKTDDSMQTFLGKSTILMFFEGLDFHGHVVEILSAHVDSLAEIVDTADGGELTADEKEIVERAKKFYGLTLRPNLVHREDCTGKRIIVVETAIDADVGAKIADIHRNIHRNRLTEPFLSETAAQLRHLLEA